MVLTDDHIYKIIVRALPSGSGELSYEHIAELANCHRNTVVNSTKRLASAGRIEMHGKSGRKPVQYKVIKHDA